MRCEKHGETGEICPECDTETINRATSKSAPAPGLSDAPDNGAVAMATSCCGYLPALSETYPVHWNPYNRVVQCHNCGTVWKPEGR